MNIAYKPEILVLAPEVFSPLFNRKFGVLAGNTHSPFSCSSCPCSSRKRLFQEDRRGRKNFDYTCKAAKWTDRLSHDLYVSNEPKIEDLTEAISQVNRNGKTSGALASSFPALTERAVSLPLDYYQVLGADTHFLADAIVRAYESRIKNLPKEGFSPEALISRQEILKGACETLADPELRGEYNEGLITDENKTIMVDVPLSKVPGALCLLHEIGEMEVVLQVGEDLLRERLGKFFQRDLVLVMALSYVELSREAMSETPPAIVHSCELLERALKLLEEEGGSSLAPALQEQIDETLQKLNPHCVLELLAFPLDMEHRGKREEGLQGLQSILWAVGEGGAFAHIPGYTREDYMKEAFTHMTAAEQVALFTSTPSNIPAESSEVYSVALAHVAEGFSSKKPYLIQEADNLFLQLQQTNASSNAFAVGGSNASTDQQLDFAFERAMCQLLLGELDDCRAWLGLDDTNSPYREPAVTDFVIANSYGTDEDVYLPGLCKLLESWLREVVFPSFRETDQLQVKLRDYYDDSSVLNYLEKLEKGESPLAAAAAIVQLGAGAGAALDSMKETLQKVFPLGKVGAQRQKNKAESPAITDIKHEQNKDYLFPYNPSIPVNTERKSGLNFSSDDDKVAEDTEYMRTSRTSVIQIVGTTALFGALILGGWKIYSMRNTIFKHEKETMSSKVAGSVAIKTNQITPKMNAQLAEQLVEKWQTAKAHALGQDHAVEKLSEVLDGQMLKSWCERARDVSKNGWYWEYKLSDLNIESVTISTDGQRAIVEATLKEAANLYDAEKCEVIDSYESSYTTRYELTSNDKSWKITSGAVLRS